jgi:hypothetical protein
VNRRPPGAMRTPGAMSPPPAKSCADESFMARQLVVRVIHDSLSESESETCLETSAAHPRRRINRVSAGYVGRRAV